MVNVSSQSIFEILRLLSAASRPLGIKEISQSLDLPPSTTHRGVVTLLHEGYVERYQSSATYVLGYNAKRLRQAFFARFRIRELCLPYLQQIAFISGETTNLLVRVGWYSTLIASVRGTNEIISAPFVGEVHALDHGAGSLAILANLPAEDLEAFLDWKKTRSSPASRRLKQTLTQIRHDGRIFIREDGGVTALPILHSGIAIAAVAIDGAIDEGMSKSDVKRIVDIVNAISQRVQQQPVGFWNAYAHLDPASIELPVS
jgi:IclR family acetate operon transcriptional repressor